MMWLTKNSPLRSGGSIVASSQQSQFPTSNLASNLASDVWRSGTTLAAETLTLTFDRIYNQATDGAANFWLILKGHNFPATCSSVTYKWVSGSLESAVGIAFTAADVLLQIPFSNPLRNYTGLILTFNKTTAGQQVQVGKLYAGIGYDTNHVDDPNPFSRTFAERSNKDYSVLGQKFAEARSQNWAASISVPLSSETVEANLRAIFAAVGTFTPFYVVVARDVTFGEFALPRYVTFASQPMERYVGFGTEGQWALTHQLEEQL